MAIRNKEGIQLKSNEVYQSNQLVLYINKIEGLNNDVIDFFDTLEYINKNLCGEIFNEWYSSYKSIILFDIGDTNLSNKCVSMFQSDIAYDVGIDYYPENNGFNISIRNFTLESYKFNEHNYKRLYALLKKESRYIEFIVLRVKEFYEKLKIFLDDFFKWVGETFKEE